MPRILAALVTTLLTTLLACLGVVVDPSIAATPDLSAVVTHVYDAAVYDEPTNYAALERGPPAAQVQLADSVSHLAVDLGLQGTLTHPGVTTTHADTHYDQPGQRDKRTGTTGSRAGAADGKLSALLRALVAANSARSAVQGSRVVSGRFPRNAGPDDILVRRGADGGVTNYQTYGPHGLPLKRIDVTGRAHGGVDTPHVVDFERHINPATGEVFVRPGSTVRPATPEELMGLD